MESRNFEMDVGKFRLFPQHGFYPRLQESVFVGSRKVSVSVFVSFAFVISNRGSVLQADVICCFLVRAFIIVSWCVSCVQFVSNISQWKISSETWLVAKAEGLLAEQAGSAAVASPARSTFETNLGNGYLLTRSASMTPGKTSSRSMTSLIGRRQRIGA